MKTTKFLIKTNGAILPGTISKAKAACGSTLCKCKKNKKFWHGPYYRWTGIIENKRTTITLTKKISLECKRRIKNYRNFKKKIQKILTLSIRSAPWNT